MISEQAKQRMRNLASRYPVARSAVMPALYIAQQEEGYITQQALQAVAEAIGLTVDDVESVATFYTMYYQHAPGKKVIKSAPVSPVISVAVMQLSITLRSAWE